MSEELSFTIDLHDKDFILYTGVSARRMDDEVVEKITKCKGEYLPGKKGFLIPKDELCNLIDECFDYFTQESLLNISTLLENNGADTATKERVREKSVSKNKARSKPAKEDPKEERVKEERVKEERVKEERVKEDRVKEERQRVIVDARRRNEELEERFKELERARMRIEPRSGIRMKKVEFDPRHHEEDSVRGELMDMMSDLRYRMDRLEKFIAKRL